MAIKEYVVVCEQDSGRPGMPHEYTGHNATLGEAIADLARAMPHYDKGSIYRVHDDGREERLPSYEEALAEVERLESARATLAERHQEAERQLHQGIARAKAETDRLKQREADIIEACEHVADGGQYRADIVSAIHRIRRERDEARALNGAEITRLRSILSAFVRTALLKPSADGWCNIVAPFPVFDEMRQEHESTPTDPIEAIEAAEQRLLRFEGWRRAENDTYGGERWEHPKHGNECRMVAISMARKAAKKGSAQQP